MAIVKIRKKNFSRGVAGQERSRLAL